MASTVQDGQATEAATKRKYFVPLGTQQGHYNSSVVELTASSLKKIIQKSCPHSSTSLACPKA